MQVRTIPLPTPPARYPYSVINLQAARIRVPDPLTGAPLETLTFIRTLRQEQREAIAAMDPETMREMRRQLFSRLESRRIKRWMGIWSRVILAMWADPRLEPSADLDAMLEAGWDELSLGTMALLLVVIHGAVYISAEVQDRVDFTPPQADAQSGSASAVSEPGDVIPDGS